MKKYEYFISDTGFTLSDWQGLKPVQFLNRYGLEGWELVQTIEEKNDKYIHFRTIWKREIA